MRRLIFCAILGLTFVAGSALAFEFRSKIKSVDADKGTVVVTTPGGQERNMKVGKDLKVLDKDGKELKDGLKAKGLAGADATLTVERDGNQPVITAIKLGQAARPGGDKNPNQRPSQRQGNLQVGDAAPDFTVPDVDGKKTVKLSDLKGKPVVLIFGSCT